MYQVSWHFIKNDTGDRDAEGFYQSKDRADVVAVIQAAIGTKDLAAYSLQYGQFTTPDQAGQYKLMGELRELVKPPGA